MESIIDRIWKSSVGQNIMKEEEATLLAKRREAVAALRALDGADALGSVKRLRREKEAAEAAMREAHEHFLAAQRKLENVQREIQSASNVSSSERSKHEAFLRETASPEIEKFTVALRDLQHVVRRDALESWVEHEKTRDLEIKEIHFSNNEEVKVWLAAIKEVIGKVEVLKLEALDPAKLGERLNKLRETISESKATAVYINNRRSSSTGDAFQIQALA